MELYDVRRTKFIQAHSSGLACIALSQDGKMVATASERGTLVRIHSTSDGTKLQVCIMHLMSFTSLLVIGRPAPSCVAWQIKYSNMFVICRSCEGEQIQRAYTALRFREESGLIGWLCHQTRGPCMSSHLISDSQPQILGAHHQAMREPCGTLCLHSPLSA